MTGKVDESGVVAGMRGCEWVCNGVIKKLNALKGRHLKWLMINMAHIQRERNVFKDWCQTSIQQ